MTASTHLKGLFAGLAAVAIAGAAIAQSTPPNPTAKDPAVGAGQQSSQSTPMGSTGTPAGGSTAAGSASGTAGSTAAGSASGSSTMGASGSPATTPADTTAAAGSRTARADRN